MDPEETVGLIVGATKFAIKGTMLDFGSNVSLMDDEIAHDLGLEVLDMPMGLHTSAGTARISGVTSLVWVDYGSGENAIATHHHFLVVPRQPKGAFRVLIGNTDSQHFGGVHDTAAGTLTLRPHYPTDHLNGRELVLPVSAYSPKGQV